MATLSEERRRKIARKAHGRTQRQLRTDTRRAERQTSRIRGGINERQAGVRRSYNRGVEQLGDISLQGLKGRYRDEAAQELSASARGLERVLPHHMNKVEARGMSRIRGINSALRDSREATFDSNFSSLLEAARSRVAAREKEQEAVQEERADVQDERAEEFKNAMQQARFMLRLGPASPDDVSEEAAEAGHPVTEEDWLQFRRSLEGKDGVGLVAARQVVNDLKRQIEQGIPGAIAKGAQILAPTAARVGLFPPAVPPNRYTGR